MSKNWKTALTDPPVGSEKGLAGRLWEALYRHLYVVPGSQAVYDDLPLTLVVKTTGPGRPTYVTWNTDFEGLSWQVNDVVSTEFTEFFHRGKENQDGSVHLHWVTTGSDATNRYIKWEVKVTAAPYNTAFPAATTLIVETLIPANTPANTHYLTPMGTYPLTLIASHIKIRVKRIASTGTAPTWNPICEQVHIHVLCDSAGSAEITTK